MRTTIPISTLLPALQAMAPLITKESNLPAGAVCIQAGDEGVRLVAAAGTDMDQAMVVELPESECSVLSPGSLVVPHDILLKLCKKLPEDAPITLRSEPENVTQVHIESGDMTLELAAFDPAELPPVPHFEINSTFSLCASELADILRRTAFAMSTDESRYVLMGTCLSLTRDQLVIAATDGRRLNRTILNQSFSWLSRADAVDLGRGDGEPLKRVDLIIPAATISTLQKLLAARDPEDESSQAAKFRLDTITVANPAKVLRIDLGRVTLFTRLVEGNYPDITKIIPEQDSMCYTAHLPVAPMLAAVSRAAVIGMGECSIRLKVGRRLELEVQNKSRMRLVDVLNPGDGYDLDGMRGSEINFNIGFLLDLIKSMSSKPATSGQDAEEGDADTFLRMSSATTDGCSPALFTSPTAPDWSHILMPMRIESPAETAEKPTQPPATEPTAEPAGTTATAA
jgi:DNA polymerase-3 subunit beta